MSFKIMGAATRALLCAASLFGCALMLQGQAAAADERSALREDDVRTAERVLKSCGCWAGLPRRRQARPAFAPSTPPRGR